MKETSGVKAITKKEAAEWIDCVAQDKRIPKNVRQMCADIALRLKKGSK